MYKIPREKALANDFGHYLVVSSTFSCEYGFFSAGTVIEILVTCLNLIGMIDMIDISFFHAPRIKLNDFVVYMCQSYHKFTTFLI